MVSPAQTPRKPHSPNVLLILLGGLFGAIASAFLASTALDLRRGRLIETWRCRCSQSSSPRRDPGAFGAERAAGAVRPADALRYPVARGSVRAIAPAMNATAPRA